MDEYGCLKSYVTCHLHTPLIGVIDRDIVSDSRIGTLEALMADCRWHFQFVIFEFEQLQHLVKRLVILGKKMCLSKVAILGDRTIWCINKLFRILKIQHNLNSPCHCLFKKFLLCYFRVFTYLVQTRNRFNYPEYTCMQTLRQFRECLKYYQESFHMHDSILDPFILV